MLASMTSTGASCSSWEYDFILGFVETDDSLVVACATARGDRRGGRYSMLAPHTAATMIALWMRKVALHPYDDSRAPTIGENTMDPIPTDDGLRL